MSFAFYNTKSRLRGSVSMPSYPSQCTIAFWLHMLIEKTKANVLEGGKKESREKGIERGTQIGKKITANNTPENCVVVRLLILRFKKFL